MHPVGMLAVAVVLCAAGSHDQGKDHVRQSRREQPTSTQHVLLQEALDSRAALINLDVVAIIAGMTSAQRVAALDTGP